MSGFLPSQLLPVIDTLLDKVSSTKLCVALSGGLDSIVLLHALAGLQSQRSWQLRALHVNHHLQQDADDWARQCADWCTQLKLPCKQLDVQVNDIRQQGVEAAAREVRYAALCVELQTDEVLLTAHHADDQLETVLIALMRGAGLDGLAAMPELTRFGIGWHARPLLGFTRDDLQAWATAQRLSYSSDPSNAHRRFDRNFLRHEVIPLLKQRWPAAAITGSRATSHLSEAKSLLDACLETDLSDSCKDRTLNIEALCVMPEARRRAVIRHWLKNNDVVMPATRVLHSLMHDLLSGDDSRAPCTCWGDHAVYRFGGRLYLEQRHQPERVMDSLLWDWHSPLTLPFDLGQLLLTPGAGHETAPGLSIDRLPPQLTVSFRQGGERIKLPREPFHRELKKLMNDAGILPWWRGRIPLIYAADQLVAVADIWCAAEFVAVDVRRAVSLQWLYDKTVVFSRN